MSFLKKLKSKKKGFTLIELIVVIAILGILAAILLPRFSGFTDNAREKSIKAEAKNVYTKMEAYYAEHGSYADSTDKLEGIVLETGAILTLTPTGDNIFTYTKQGYTATCTKDGTITVQKSAA
ncbi:type IV pilin protein [Hathewaya histolytica]|uniref:type IV pilin protein n=1 Tax=Hathewaya histolytica TaxID=1498 RepID=UPI003B684FB5